MNLSLRTRIVLLVICVAFAIATGGGRSRYRPCSRSLTSYISHALFR